MTPPSPISPPERGAYGLLLSEGFPLDLLVAAPLQWTRWTVRVSVTPAGLCPPDDQFYVTGDFARLPCFETGWADIDRPSQTTTLFVDHPLSPAEMIHPGPVVTAAIVAWWAGRQALHGTAVGRDGRAVGFLGGREHGKSTTSMRLLRAGWELVSDDALVIAGNRVMAGPRTLDLREPSARRLGAGTYIGKVGQRERWREVTAQSAPEFDLAGLVELEWGEELRVTRLGPAERFVALQRHRMIPALPPLDSVGLLATLAVPVLRLSRPRDLDQLEPSIAAVMAELGLS